MCVILSFDQVDRGQGSHQSLDPINLYSDAKRRSPFIVINLSEIKPEIVFRNILFGVNAKNCIQHKYSRSSILYYYSDTYLSDLAKNILLVWRLFQWKNIFVRHGLEKHVGNLLANFAKSILDGLAQLVHNIVGVFIQNHVHLVA